MSDDHALSRRRYLAAAATGGVGGLAGCQDLGDVGVPDAGGPPGDGSLPLRWLPARDVFGTDVGVRYQVVPAAKLRADRTDVEDEVFANLYLERTMPRGPTFGVEEVDGFVDLAVGRTRADVALGSFDRARVAHALSGVGAVAEGERGTATVYAPEESDDREAVRFALDDGVLVRAEAETSMQARTVLGAVLEAGQEGTDRLQDADSPFAATFEDPGVGHRFRLVGPAVDAEHDRSYADAMFRGERFRARNLVADGGTVTMTLRVVFETATDPGSVRDLVHDDEAHDNPFRDYRDVSVEVDGDAVVVTGSAENPSEI